MAVLKAPSFLSMPRPSSSWHIDCNNKSEVAGVGEMDKVSAMGADLTYATSDYQEPLLDWRMKVAIGKPAVGKSNGVAPSPAAD